MLPRLRVALVLPTEKPRRPRRRRRERLDRRTVDERADAGGASAQHRGERAERGGVTDPGLAERHRQLERTAPVHDDRAAERLRDEVAPRVLGVGAGGAEAGDGDDRQRAPVREQLVAVDAPIGEAAESGCLDHEVDAVEQLRERRRRLRATPRRRRSACSCAGGRTSPRRHGARRPRVVPPSPRRRRGPRRPCRTIPRRRRFRSRRPAGRSVPVARRPVSDPASGPGGQRSPTTIRGANGCYMASTRRRNPGT